MLQSSSDAYPSFIPPMLCSFLALRLHFVKKLAVTFPGATQDLVEMQAGNTQVGADLLLVIVGDVKPKQDFAITVRFQRRKNPPRQSGLFLAQQLVQLADLGRDDL